MTTTNTAAIKTVHRYKFAAKGEVCMEAIFMIPSGAEVLTVEMSSTSGPVLFALVEVAKMNAEDVEPRKFRLVKTGEEFDATGAKYIKTLTVGGPSVHLFELPA